MQAVEDLLIVAGFRRVSVPQQDGPRAIVIPIKDLTREKIERTRATYSIRTRFVRQDWTVEAGPRIVTFRKGRESGIINSANVRKFPTADLDAISDFILELE